MWQVHTIEEMAKHIGRSRTWVTNRGRELGLAPREICGYERAARAAAATRHARATRPDQPRGFTPDQITWALSCVEYTTTGRMTVTNQEARAILGLKGAYA